jgi:hypothetical protein
MPHNWPMMAMVLRYKGIRLIQLAWNNLKH